eukprot:SAG31_NODE_19802_length_591_cov_1.036585_1_plen_62_part_10
MPGYTHLRECGAVVLFLYVVADGSTASLLIISSLIFLPPPEPAQPIRWSHWMLSHAWAWQRD